MSPRILVVDDEERWREQFRDILEIIGEVDTTKDFVEAKGLLRRLRYDLILVDVCLDQPDFNVFCQGFFAFLHRTYPDLPIVATSGKEISPPSMWELSKYGVVDFIYKPHLNLQNFRQRIQVVLDLDMTTIANEDTAASGLAIIWERRLNDLVSHITEDMALLKGYEDALRYEDDPRRWTKYRQEIEKLRKSAACYQQEYDELRAQAVGELPTTMQNVAAQLRYVNDKLNRLLVGQNGIHDNLTHLSPSLDARRGPTNLIEEKIRLDVASPETVEVNRTFEIAVRISQPASPPLNETDLTRVTSRSGTVYRADDEEIVRYRVKVSAPDCDVHTNEHVFLLRPGQDSEVVFFQLAAKREGTISIIVTAYQEDDLLAAQTRIRLVATLMARPTYYALLVGVGDYTHPRFASLPATVRDAQAVATVLTDPARCGYPPGNVQTITGLDTTVANIRAALQSLAQSTGIQSTVFIYFSGHGGRALLPSPAGGRGAGGEGRWRAYLCPREADPDDLAHTAISGDEFSALLAAIPARKLLVMLDACHAAGSAELKAADGTVMWKAGLSDDYYEALSQGSGRVVIASSKAEQYSYVRKQGELSLFTWHLCEALGGKAAVRGDGLIHVLDVFPE